MIITERQDGVLESLQDDYLKRGEPIPISVRKIMASSPSSSAHKIHSYPAKLLPNLAKLLIRSHLMPYGGKMLDPFCGTGTTLLEGVNIASRLYGADANPLARLITSVKLNKAPSGVCDCLKSIERGIRQKRKAPAKHHEILSRWFTKEDLDDISYIGKRISEINDDCLKSFLNVCLSAILKDLSCADPRVAVPVKLKKSTYPTQHWYRSHSLKRLKQFGKKDVFNEFSTRVTKYFSFKQQQQTNCNFHLFEDSRELTYKNVPRKLKSNSVDFVVTSPPYGTAQKYIRSSTFSLLVLDLNDNLTISDLDRMTIGSENLLMPNKSSVLVETMSKKANRVISEVFEDSPYRAHLYSSYLNEMQKFIEESYRVLKAGASISLVIGNNQVSGRVFETCEYLKDLAEAIGFKTTGHFIDSIKSRGLMTRRNSSSGMIAHEHIIIFRK